jgi:hypothetical protein
MAIAPSSAAIQTANGYISGGGRQYKISGGTFTTVVGGSGGTFNTKSCESANWKMIFGTQPQSMDPESNDFELPAGDEGNGEDSSAEALSSMFLMALISALVAAFV